MTQYVFLKLGKLSIIRNQSHEPSTFSLTNPIFFANEAFSLQVYIVHTFLRCTSFLSITSFVSSFQGDWQSSGDTIASPRITSNLNKSAHTGQNGKLFLLSLSQLSFITIINFKSLYARCYEMQWQIDKQIDRYVE